MTYNDDEDAYWEAYEAAQARIGNYDGLTRVGVLELTHADYAYNLIGAWKGADGYYLATDSGCSCPTPWENTPRESLTGSLTAAQACEEVSSHVRNEQESKADPEGYYYGDGPDEGEVKTFLARLV